MDQAIRVACDLLAQDLDTPATVDVAALRYGRALRDAGPAIRDMLREQGFPAAGPDANETNPCQFFIFPSATSTPQVHFVHEMTIFLSDIS